MNTQQVILTEEELRKEVSRLIRLYKRRMKLQNWIVSHQFNDDPEWDNEAEVTCIDGRQEAVIVVSSTMQWTADYLRRTIAHELTHCITEDVRRLAEQWQRQVARKQRKLFEQQFNDAIEHIVSHVSEVICDLRR